MYDINLERVTWEEYVYKTKNEHNQLLKLYIFREDGIWHVCFFIATKRKHGYQQYCQTGKGGLSSLIWAKNCILDWIADRTSKKIPGELRIYADDSRRMNIYKRYLIPKGFKLSFTREPYLYLKY